MRTRGISTGLPAQDSAPNTGGPAAPDAVEPPWSGPDVRLPSSGQAYNPATSGGLRPYLVIALDKQVPEALEKRLKVRDAHLAEARAGKEAGRVLVGGGVLGALDFPPVEAPAQETANQLAGSALVVIAEVCFAATLSIDELLFLTYHEGEAWGGSLQRSGADS